MMRMKMTAAALAASAALTLVLECPPGMVRAAAAPMQVIGFWANDASSGLAGLYKYPHAITWFTPFWYAVGANGQLINKANPSILAKVRAAHVPITPLVNDATGRQLFLSNTSTRLNAARNIADMVKAEHFQGVSIDFEPPVNALAPDLAAFTLALRDYLPRGSVITMSIVPQSGGAYEWAKLTPEVNQFILMAYDQHDDGSYAGPVAATPWVQNIISRMTPVVPPGKIDLGVAVYGYTWPRGSTTATTIPYNATTPQMRLHAKWDIADQETYATYGNTIAWWESLQGMNQKIQLAKADHLAGIALWHMGYASDSVYQLLLSQVGKQP
jgi:spore germination protein YaaH